tara:strand:- start:396 stop:602 length:207 start_codon:yes stop_codon:yes gene_type:complete
MKIRNPFKDYLGRWKDDVTTKEKFIWSLMVFSVIIIFLKSVGFLGSWSAEGLLGLVGAFALYHTIKKL